MALHDRHAKMSAKLHEAERKAAQAAAAQAATEAHAQDTGHSDADTISSGAPGSVSPHQAPGVSGGVRADPSGGTAASVESSGRDANMLTNDHAMEPHGNNGYRSHLYPPESDSVVFDTSPAAHRLTARSYSRSPGRSPTSPTWSSHSTYQPSRAGASLAPTSILPAVHRVERAQKRLSWATMLLDRMVQHAGENANASGEDSEEDSDVVTDEDGMPLRFVPELIVLYCRGYYSVYMRGRVLVSDDGTCVWCGRGVRGT